MVRVQPVVAHESTVPETLQALARVGHGIAILPTTARLDTDVRNGRNTDHRDQFIRHEGRQGESPRRRLRRLRDQTL
jgi:hypothetical protein